jgi:hypothetical protein
MEKVLIRWVLIPFYLRCFSPFANVKIPMSVYAIADFAFGYYDYREKDSYGYDGTAKTPDVTVELDDAILEPDIDYDVAYSNNIEIGTAKVTVTGKGYYTGSIEKTFTINKDGSTSGTNPETLKSCMAHGAV